MKQIRIPAQLMRGGTSKGLFFRESELPADPAARDRLLLRALGSPDPYGRQMDGLGGATSSTSKVIVVARSTRPGCDLDYRFGAVSIEAPRIDWSSNCGNLTAAVAPFAIHTGLLTAPPDGIATLRLWQRDIQRRIDAHVPMQDGAVQELGGFGLDGVAFPAARIQLDFLDPAVGESVMFPSGQRVDTLNVPGLGPIEATLINAGNPMVVIKAESLGLHGSELPQHVNAQEPLLERAEALRAAGAVAMGLPAQPAVPNIALVAPPQDYVATDGRHVRQQDVDLMMRGFTMGTMHHALPGTAAVALAAAAAVPGTLVRRLAQLDANGHIRIGHAAGCLDVGVRAEPHGADWVISSVRMARSARRLMEGWIWVPEDAGC